MSSMSFLRYFTAHNNLLGSKDVNRGDFKESPKKIFTQSLCPACRQQICEQKRRRLLVSRSLSLLSSRQVFDVNETRRRHCNEKFTDAFENLFSRASLVNRSKKFFSQRISKYSILLRVFFFVSLVDILVDALMPSECCANIHIFSVHQRNGSQIDITFI